MDQTIDNKIGALIAPQTSGQSAATPKPSLIVTSNQSRSTYADNVTKLNNSIQSSKAPVSEPTFSIGDVNKFVEEYQKQNSSAPAVKVGPDGSIVKNDAPTTGASNGTGGTDTTKTNGGNSNTSPEDTEGATNEDGTINVRGDDGNIIKIDPSLKSQYDTSMAKLDQGINDAKNTLAQVSATLQNDPAAQNAVNLIITKFQDQIDVMKKKNNILLGSYKKNSARTGMLQYANEMDGNFMSEEQDVATKRLTDLSTRETQAVLKAQSAYKKGDLAAFTKASKELDTANKGKTDAIDKLLSATDKIVKQHQAAVKLKDAEAKQKITDDIRLSSNLSKVIADTIEKSGIKDPEKIDAYIEAMAEKSGISNSDILRSAVYKSQDAAAKTDLSIANTKDIIAKRGKGKAVVDPNYKFTPKSVTKLYGAGNSKSEINALQADIAKYGAKKVIEEGQMDDDTKAILQDEFGL